VNEADSTLDPFTYRRWPQEVHRQADRWREESISAGRFPYKPKGNIQKSGQHSSVAEAQTVAMVRLNQESEAHGLDGIAGIDPVKRPSVYYKWVFDDGEDPVSSG